MTTNAAPERTINELPPAILQGIVDGHIDHTIESVKITAKSSPTNKDESQEFDALYALDAQGMALLCGGKIEPQTQAPAEGDDTRTPEQKRLGACDHFNYGRILSVRQTVRTNLESRLEGPEKMIEKTVKANLSSGMFDTEAEAREFVVTRLKAQGKLPADYGVKAA